VGGRPDQQWVRSEKPEAVPRLLAGRLHEQGKLNLEEAFEDATFASAKKGDFAVSPTCPRHLSSRLPSQIRQQLSLALPAVILRRLVPGASGDGRYPAIEIMLATGPTRNLIHRGDDLNPVPISRQDERGHV